MIRFLGWGVGNGVLCFSLGSRVRGNDVGASAGMTWACGNDVAVNFGHPLRAAHASPSLCEGEGNGVLCFSLVSRVRGNDVGGTPVNFGHPLLAVLASPFAERRGGVVVSRAIWGLDVVHGGVVRESWVCR